MTRPPGTAAEYPLQARCQPDLRDEWEHLAALLPAGLAAGLGPSTARRTARMRLVIRATARSWTGRGPG